MAIDPDRLKSLVLPDIEQRYDERDAMLHALAVGYEPSANDPRELDFVYERSLKVAPSLPLTLCHRSLATMDIGIDFRKVVHGAQSLVLHAPLPASATIVCATRVDELWDLGANRGALLVLLRELRDKADGALLATTRMSALCRGDGGFGGAPAPAAAAWSVSGAPDFATRWRILPQQAALYRLQGGDMNPLHIDPERAVSVGFERPILHGLCTFAGCVRAVLGAALGYDTARLRRVEGRFSAPIHPGETLQVEIWRAGPSQFRFRARAAERDLIVIKDGVALETA